MKPMFSISSLVMRHPGRILCGLLVASLLLASPAFSADPKKDPKKDAKKDDKKDDKKPTTTPTPSSPLDKKDEPKAPAKNLIPNGDFERVSSFENLYDGVDAQGNIKMFRCIAHVYISGSQFSHIPFSSSACLADVNGDGKQDLVSCSPLGFLLWFPNTGTKEAPSWGNGVIVPTYLGTAARIFVTDWNGDGKFDILFGNIEGNVNILLNGGGATDPKWAEQGNPRWFPPEPPPVQPGYQALVVNHGSNPINIGVYSAPTFADWNKDGLNDLIVGEGSYSANSVRIWLNTGSSSSPSFSQDSPFFLAYGDGREQLAPCVYDWNNDGIMDLLVGDRDGQIALYLGTAEAIKDPKAIGTVDFTKYITLNGRESWGSLISIHACDYNNDGMPDILYGTTSGTVLVALGKGKREDPQFESSAQLKGVDFAKNFKQPAAWDNEAFGKAAEGAPYTATAPMPQSISLEDDPNANIKEGKRSLHLTWFNNFWGWMYHHGLFTALKNGYDEGLVYYSNQVLPFLMDKEYEFSFWHRGNSMRVGYQIEYSETYQDPKNPKGPPVRSPVLKFTDSTTVSAEWGQYKRTYRFPATRDNDNKRMDSAGIRLFIVGPGDAWVDDMKLMEVQAK